MTRPGPTRDEYPVVDLVLPMPLLWAEDVMWALGHLKKRGYRLYFRESDGLGRVWASRGPGPA